MKKQKLVSPTKALFISAHPLPDFFYWALGLLAALAPKMALNVAGPPTARVF